MRLSRVSTGAVLAALGVAALASPVSAQNNIDLSVSGIQRPLQVLPVGPTNVNLKVGSSWHPQVDFELTVDWSGVSNSIQIEVHPSGMECQTTATSSVCRGATLPDPERAEAGIYFNVGGEAATGPAGRIKYSVRATGEGVVDANQGNNSGQTDLEVIRGQMSADMELTVPAAVGNVGDTVIVPVTLHNHGPNTQTFYAFYNDHAFLADPLAFEFAGFESCALRDDKCEFTYIPPGESRTVRIKVRILTCTRPGWDYLAVTRMYGVSDPNPYNSANFLMDVKGVGCALPDERPGAKPVEDPGPATPTQAPSAGDLAAPSAEAADLKTLAADRPESLMWTVLVGGLVITLLLSGAVRLRRRRQSTDPG